MIKIINNLNKREKIIFQFFFFLIIFSYFLGFTLNENSAGGALVDFENTKRNLATFDSNSFLDAIKATASLDYEVFQSTRTPGFYIFNKYLNPFTGNIKLHQLFTSLVSLLIPIFLFLNLKIKFKNINNYYLILLSSIILLSPYFRSTAFWGNEENFGILIVAISSYLFQKYFKTSSRKNELIYLNLLALFSSLTVYCDQKLIIIPLITFISILFSKKKLSDKVYLTFLYIIFAIPFVFLIKLWGNIVPSGDAGRRKINFSLINLNYHYFLYSISIISFYLFPFFFSLKDKGKKIINIIKLKDNYFYSFIFLIFLTYFLFFFDLQNMYFQGGGVFDKLAKLLFETQFFKKIFLSIIFIISWLLILCFKDNNNSNFLILIFFPIFSLLISPALFQEYFDPLIFFLILVYLKNDYSFKFTSSLFILNYFFVFLFVGIIFY